MKKILHLIRYIRLFKKNKQFLSDSRIKGIQYDWIYRLYTVLNLPFEDKENIKRYGHEYVDNMVREHIKTMNEYLFELGILEYVELDTENIIQIDEFNVRIVLKFKHINIKSFVLYILPLIIIILTLGTLFFILF